MKQKFTNACAYAIVATLTLTFIILCGILVRWVWVVFT